MKTSAQLQSDVRSELAWDPRVDDKNINVVVTGGVATLSGTVPTFADRFAAERAAERVFGIRSVANELAVAVPVHYERSDTDIAHAVVNALSWDVEVPDTRIKSSVSNGVVRLDGDVDFRYQREAAAKAVRNLAGVKEVINAITVSPKSVSAADVSQSIKQALERRADRTADRINVQTVGGVVTLSGSVGSIGDRRAAEGAAWSAPGVTDVRDDLAISV
jgi:osmotically-inducible protein OsmY